MAALHVIADAMRGLDLPVTPVREASPLAD
jgi:hypothetical protein